MHLVSRAMPMCWVNNYVCLNVADAVRDETTSAPPHAPRRVTVNLSTLSQCIGTCGVMSCVILCARCGVAWCAHWLWVTCLLFCDALVMWYRVHICGIAYKVWCSATEHKRKEDDRKEDDRKEASGGSNSHPPVEESGTNPLSAFFFLSLCLPLAWDTQRCVSAWSFVLNKCTLRVYLVLQTQQI